MTRQLKLLSAVMFLFVFATGQTTGYGCLDDCIDDEVAGIFDGDGCLAGMVGGCGDCGSCMDCGACSDCSSCGCDGCVIEKIPGTYGPRPAALNVTQVRLTSSGFAFLESMLAPMLGSTLSPMTKELVTGGDRSIEVLIGAVGSGAEKRICASGRVDSCGAEIDIENVKVIAEPQDPGHDRLRLRMELKVLLVSHSGSTRHVGWLSQERTCVIGICGGWSNCTLGYSTAPGALDSIDVEIVFELGTSGVEPRADINVISMLPMSGSTGGIEGVEVAGEVTGCGLGGLVNNDIAGYVVYRVTEELNNRIPQLVRTILCESPNNLLGENGVPGVCPAPTTQRTYSYGMDGILPPTQGCGVDNNACLPMLLGLEGRMDLGGLLGSVIPGYSAVLDFLFAVAGGATTENNGLSMWMKGGIDSITGHSDCVPVLPAEEIPPFPVVPRAQVFHGNVHPTTAREPAIMVGVSEQFANWAAYTLWDSGGICVQIGSTTLPMLDPSLVGILFGTSLKSLVFPASDANSPLGIGLRPQKPPAVTFEPLEGEPGLAVNVDMPQIELDFYAWSLDRYVRFVTFVMDINLSVQVKSADGKVGIYLGDIGLTNVSSKNDDLLANPGSAVSLLGGVVAGLIPSFLGDSSAPLFELDLATLIPSEIDLGGTPVPLPLGVELREDAFGVVHVDAAGNTVATRDEAADTLMGIFVDFTTGSAPSTGLEGAIETSVEVTSLHIPEDRSAFQAETFAQGELPRVEILMSATAPAGVPLEYRYRLALGGWSEWQDSPYAVIESPMLLLQQEHLIMARARVKGDPRSEDKSSAFTKVRVDVSEPMIELAADSKGVRLQAVDLQTPIKQLEYRFRDPGGEFSEWTAFGEETTALLDAGRDVEVQVRDESGNIGSNVEELRGLPEPSADGGCSCTVAGKPTSSGSTLGFLAMLAVLGGTFFRVRRRRHSA